MFISTYIGSAYIPNGSAYKMAALEGIFEQRIIDLPGFLVFL